MPSNLIVPLYKINEFLKKGGNNQFSCIPLFLQLLFFVVVNSFRKLVIKILNSNRNIKYFTHF